MLQHLLKSMIVLSVLAVACMPSQGYPFIAVSNAASLTATRCFAVTDRIARANAISDHHACHSDGRSDGLYDSACTYPHTPYVHPFTGWYNLLL